ncbi:MAG: DUF211 domain-containing protein [Gammaproteobacteria bacterium]|nr:DUF211 domain-containing protein [Gammaproteobacteria bacterium]
MAVVKRIVLDVLKPHNPNVLEFARRIADEDPGSHVQVRVTEMDEKTETLVVVIEGAEIDIDRVEAALKSMGASLHSIDEVEVIHERGVG